MFVVSWMICRETTFALVKFRILSVPFHWIVTSYRSLFMDNNLNSTFAPPIFVNQIIFIPWAQFTPQLSLRWDILLVILPLSARVNTGYADIIAKIHVRPIIWKIQNFILWWIFKVSEFELSWENEFCKMKWLTLKMNHRLLRCLLTVFVIIFGTTVQYRSNAIATNVNITTAILKNITKYKK